MTWHYKIRTACPPPAGAAGGSDPCRHRGALMLDNVDTDVISPLGKPPTPGMTKETAAFEPIRFYSDGRERTDFILNREGYRRALNPDVGKNFGTGSSRGKRSADRWTAAFAS